MAQVRIKLNGKGVRQLLLAPGIAADLQRRGEAVAAAAGDGMEVRPGTSTKRARVSVATATPAAMEAEARHRALSSAIDEARK